jgi:hypothetical protein
VAFFLQQLSTIAELCSFQTGNSAAAAHRSGLRYVGTLRFHLETEIVIEILTSYNGWLERQMQPTSQEFIEGIATAQAGDTQTA